MSVALHPALTPTYLTGAPSDMLAAGRTGALLPPEGHRTDSLGAPRSLDDRLVDAVHSAGTTSRQQMAAVQAAMPALTLFSEGEDEEENEMINLQNRLADLSLGLSLQSALASKTVKAVETLVKS